MTFRFTTPKFGAIELDKKAFQTVSIYALKAVGRQARTVAAKSIYERYNLPYGEISAAISVDASPSKQIVILSAKGKMFPLIKFVKDKVSDGMRSYRYFTQGIRYEVVRGQQKYLPNAFFARMPGGHVGVFERVAGGTKRTKGRPETSSPNLPIMEHFRISVADMFKATIIKNKMQEFITDNFKRLLDHEIEYYLSNGR